MKNGRVDVPKIEAKLLGNTITGQLTAENADSDKPAVKGSLQAKGADLAGLLAVAAGFQADGAGLRDMAKELRKEKDKSFNVSADFDADMNSGRIELPKLSADLLGLEIRGSVKGDDVDSRRAMARSTASSPLPAKIPVPCCAPSVRPTWPNR